MAGGSGCSVGSQEGTWASNVFSASLTCLILHDGDVLQTGNIVLELAARAKAPPPPPPTPQVPTFVATAGALATGVAAWQVTAWQAREAVAELGKEFADRGRQLNEAEARAKANAKAELSVLKQKLDERERWIQAAEKAADMSCDEKTQLVADVMARAEEAEMLAAATAAAEEAAAELQEQLAEMECLLEDTEERAIEGEQALELARADGERAVLEAKEAVECTKTVAADLMKQMKEHDRLLEVTEARATESEARAEANAKALMAVKTEGANALEVAKAERAEALAAAIAEAERAVEEGVAEERARGQKALADAQAAAEAAAEELLARLRNAEARAAAGEEALAEATVAAEAAANDLQGQLELAEACRQQMEEPEAAMDARPSLPVIDREARESLLNEAEADLRAARNEMAMLARQQANVEPPEFTAAAPVGTAEARSDDMAEQSPRRSFSSFFG